VLRVLNRADNKLRGSVPNKLNRLHKSSGLKNPDNKRNGMKHLANQCATFSI